MNRAMAAHSFGRGAHGRRNLRLTMGACLLALGAAAILHFEFAGRDSGSTHRASSRADGARPPPTTRTTDVVPDGNESVRTSAYAMQLLRVLDRCFSVPEGESHVVLLRPVLSVSLHGQLTWDSHFFALVLREDAGSIEVLTDGFHRERFGVLSPDTGLPADPRGIAAGSGFVTVERRSLQELHDALVVGAPTIPQLCFVALVAYRRNEPDRAYASMSRALCLAGAHAPSGDFDACRAIVDGEVLLTIERAASRMAHDGVPYQDLIRHWEAVRSLSHEAAPAHAELMIDAYHRLIGLAEKPRDSPGVAEDSRTPRLDESFVLGVAECRRTLLPGDALIDHSDLWRGTDLLGRVLREGWSSTTLLASHVRDRTPTRSVRLTRLPSGHVYSSANGARHASPELLTVGELCRAALERMTGLSGSQSVAVCDSAARDPWGYLVGLAGSPGATASDSASLLAAAVGYLASGDKAHRDTFWGMVGSDATAPSVREALIEAIELLSIDVDEDGGTALELLGHSDPGRAALGARLILLRSAAAESLPSIVARAASARDVAGLDEFLDTLAASRSQDTTALRTRVFVDLLAAVDEPLAYGATLHASSFPSPETVDALRALVWRERHSAKAMDAVGTDRSMLEIAARQLGEMLRLPFIPPESSPPQVDLAYAGRLVDWAGQHRARIPWDRVRASAFE